MLCDLVATEISHAFDVQSLEQLAGDKDCCKLPNSHSSSRYERFQELGIIAGYRQISDMLLAHG